MTPDKRLKKANEVIHISNKLTLLERKLFNALLWSAYPDLLKKRKHRISRKELGKIVGFDSNDTKLLKDALRRLRETEIEWVTTSGTNEDWTTSGFIASGRLTKGICEFSFSAHLQDLLYHPRFYTRFFLEIQRRLSSYQTLALYENCKRFQRVKSTGWIDVDMWRKLLGVDKLPSYANFKVFNSRVIKRSVEEINKHADISLKVEYRRESRKVSAIRFKISPNTQPTLFETPEERDDLEDRYNAIVSAMDETQIKQLEEKFKEEILKDSIILWERYTKTGFESRAVQITFQEYVVEQASNP